MSGVRVEEDEDDSSGSEFVPDAVESDDEGPRAKKRKEDEPEE